MTKSILFAAIAALSLLLMAGPTDAGDLKLKFGWHMGTPVYPTPIYPPPPGFYYAPDYPYYLYGPPPRYYRRYYGPNFGIEYQHGRHGRGRGR